MAAAACCAIAVIASAVPAAAVGGPSADKPVIKEYKVPGSGGFGGVYGITTGPDGALWFTQVLLGNVGRITTRGKVTGVFAAPGGQYLAPITAGPDGNLWTGFGGPNGTGVDRVTTGGVFTAVNVAGPGAVPAIVTGPNGALWFDANGTDSGGAPQTDYIGRVRADLSASLPPDLGRGGYGCIASLDGALWFQTAYGPGYGPPANQILEITPGGATALYSAPGPGSQSLAAADGVLWMDDTSNDTIDTMTTAGVITAQYPAPIDSGTALTAGPNGTVWFTEPAANAIGCITPGGHVTSYPLPSPNAGLADITTGPDCNIWFTERTTNQIGELILPAPPLATSATTSSTSSRDG
jgi:virginiamycin B lyase